MASRRDAARSARISGPGELLQAVPYLLGFRPASSLALVGMDGLRLMVTARLDLADAVRGAIPHAVTTMARGGSTSFVAVIYDDDAVHDPDGAPPWAGLVYDLEAAVADVPGALCDVLLVSRGRWWSLNCVDPLCCPTEGNEVPEAPSSFTAAAIVDGVAVLPNRAAVADLLAPLPDEQRSSLEAAITDAEHLAVRQTITGRARTWELSTKRALFRAARQAGEPGWRPQPDEVVARFGAALRVISMRDACWLAIESNRLDGRSLWRDLGRRLPSPYDAPPLFLFAWSSWRAGDGALAGIAAELALASVPDYSAADLLMSALSAGTDPRRMPRLRPPRAGRAGVRAGPHAPHPVRA